MSIDMHNTQPERIAAEDWLDRALRAEGAAQRSDYIADDGFTASVVAQLPVAATAPAWRRPAVALLWLGAGIAALMAVPGLFDDTFRGSVAMVVGHRFGVADVAVLLGLLAAATWSSLIYAARAE
ncbi:MAG: hypothetical protein ABI537_01575 [Casimicrobiaceae bacterium]